MNPRSLTFTVNGTSSTIEVNPVKRLSDVIRAELGLTGTKVGCDAGDCGACSVLIDGEVACACLVPVAQIDGASIETVDGLSSNGTLGQLQQSFLHHGCCTVRNLHTRHAYVCHSIA